MNSDVFDPALNEFRSLISVTSKHLPYIVSAMIVAVAFLIVAWLFRKYLSKRMIRQGKNPLIIRASSNISFIAILIVGLYLALKISGLSGLAFTLIGGTGVIGIAVGLALRSTAENYLAGMILSLRKVFRTGDYVEINGREGIVQAVNSRSTLIMDFDGNNISIPNSEVYSATIKNLTNNPKMRISFNVGIGYDDSIDSAREVILKIFDQNDDKILSDPSPLVCVDSLGSATVNLRVYFWFDATKYSMIKVKSFVIQAVKEQLMAAHISMPDDAREIVFANPLQISRSHKVSNDVAVTEPAAAHQPSENILQSFGGDLTPETDDIKKQSKESRTMEEGTNLL